jgi:hypothetical protein
LRGGTEDYKGFQRLLGGGHFRGRGRPVRRGSLPGAALRDLAADLRLNAARAFLGIRVRLTRSRAAVARPRRRDALLVPQGEDRPEGDQDLQEGAGRHFFCSGWAMLWRIAVSDWMFSIL